MRDEEIANLYREFEEFYFACETEDGEPVAPTNEAMARAANVLYPTKPKPSTPSPRGA